MLDNRRSHTDAKFRREDKTVSRRNIGEPELNHLS